MADDFTFSTQVAPEVLAYLDAKNLRPGFSWLDVWGEEHAHAFTVAKAMELDVLDTIRAEIRKSLADGETFETFRDNLEPKLRALGWWGRREMVDPDTGEAEVVQLGSPRRLRVIFQANVRSARAAGQWERIQRTKALLPFLLYQLGSSEKHRPHHADKEGLVLPVDDPFWLEWMPPNGWRCKCSVRQLTRSEAEARGISESPSIERRPFVNRRSGEVTDVPVGIDPGWQTNSGQARMATLLTGLADRLGQAGEANAREAIATLWREPFARAFANTTIRIGAPVGLSGEAQAALNAQSPIVAVFNDTVRAKTRKHAPVAPGSFDLVPEILESGHLVNEVRQGAVAVFAEIDGQWWKLALTRSAAGFLRVSTLHHSSQEKFDRALRRADRS